MCAHRVEVGPTRVHEHQVTAVCFHGFEALQEIDIIQSPEFKSLGHSWTLEIIRPSNDIAFCLWLTNWSGASIDVEFYFSVRKSGGKEVARSRPRTKCYQPNIKSVITKFANIPTLNRALVGGDLTVEVTMRKAAPEEGITPTPVFVPENPLCKNILNKFLDEESADVVFEVDGEDGRAGGEQKRARTSPTVFHAHRSVLRHGAPTLADLCTPREGGGEGEGEGDSVTIQITGVRAEALRLLLYYAYGGKIAAEELTAHARDLVDAADRYGLASLKLEAEASYVKSTTLTIDNVLDNLLYAHSKNCPLLQEAVMDFVVENSNLVMDKVSFDDVPGSAMKDLLAAVTRGKKETGANEADGYNGMRVGALRKMLHEKGLEVDGSREAMIALLKEHP